MGSTLSSVNPTIVAAFRAALVHQGLVILVVALLLAVFGVVVRSRQPGHAAQAGQAAGAGRAGDSGQAGQAAGAGPVEPAARRLLRISFGLLWIFDGLLQAQPAMPVGLADQVTVPAAGSSPLWVQHIANWAGLVWDTHPIQAAAAAVWIQLGIGVWMLACSRGPLSRLSGAGSIVWGLAVWIFGEAFGGIFAPGLTFLFGAPGAVLFYVVAGALLALPERYWSGRRIGRAILGVTGLFFLGMALLQAWPGRGFWQGRGGTLPGMIRDMAQTSQPHWISSLVSDFGSLVAAHGFAVNLVAVIALAVIGLAFLSSRDRVIRVGLVVAVVFCLADWVLIEDFGFFGGLGTDPNSMVPVIALVLTGYVAVTRVPAPATEPAADAAPAGDAGPAVPARVAGLRHRLGLARMADMSVPGDLMRALVGVGAVIAVLVGTVPMAVASTSPSADTIVATALNGTPGSTNYPAPGFQLTDQHGRQVSLASLHGRAVLLTFLDPVCTTDCPLIAQEFREADTLLGSASRNVVLIAIVANPLYRSVSATQAFDRQEHMAQVPNWLYLTGSTAQLSRVWKAYGIPVQIVPGGGMVAHPDVAYVIDPQGHTRLIIDADPGPGTGMTMASFSAQLAQAARQVMSS
jgi:cytochrome oxidase Cu insertion factor (SCO1/SenC/PrrC family)